MAAKTVPGVSLENYRTFLKATQVSSDNLTIFVSRLAFRNLKGFLGVLTTSLILATHLLVGNACDSAFSSAHAEAVDIVDAILLPSPRTGGLSRRLRVFQTGKSERVLAENLERRARSFSGGPSQLQREAIADELAKLENSTQFISDAELRVLIGGSSLFFENNTEHFAHRSSLETEPVEDAYVELWDGLIELIAARLKESSSISLDNFSLKTFRFSERVVLLKAFRSSDFLSSLRNPERQKLYEIASSALSAPKRSLGSRNYFFVRLEASLLIGSIAAEASSSRTLKRQIKQDLLRRLQESKSSFEKAAIFRILRLLSRSGSFKLSNSEILPHILSTLNSLQISNPILRNELAFFLRGLGGEGIDVLINLIEQEVDALPSSDDEIEWSRFKDQTALVLSAVNFVSLPVTPSQSLALLPFARYRFRVQLYYLIKLMQEVAPNNKAYVELLEEIHRRHPKFFVSLEAGKIYKNSASKRQAQNILENGLKLGLPQEVEIDLGMLPESKMGLLLELVKEPSISDSAAKWCVSKIRGFERLSTTERIRVAELVSFKNILWWLQNKHIRIFIQEPGESNLDFNPHSIHVLKGRSDATRRSILREFFKSEIEAQYSEVLSLLESHEPLLPSETRSSYFVRRSIDFLDGGDLQLERIFSAP